MGVAGAWAILVPLPASALFVGVAGGANGLGGATPPKALAADFDEEPELAI